MKIKPYKWSYFSFLVLIGGGPTLIALITALVRPGLEAYKLLAVCLFMELVFLFYIKNHYIEFDERKIHINKLLFSKDYLFEDIKSVDIEVGIKGNAPFSRIVFDTKYGWVYINAKLFKSDELKLLIDKINNK